jgi:fructose-bisphosphate aldolase class II
LALVGLKKQLDWAVEKRVAVPAFNVSNMEMLIGVIGASEEENVPIILQIAEKRLRYSPLETIGSMLVSAAKKAKIDVCVQLDHGRDIEILRGAARLGFSSLMFDGSEFPLLENIAKTKAVTNEFSEQGIEIEAEVGVLAGDEGAGEKENFFTNPDDAAKVARESGCAALAVSIGNAHGNYKEEPELNFGALKKIAEKTTVPLVLHGGSGISDADFLRAIKLGIRKINIATAILNAFVEGCKNYLRENQKTRANYFGMNEAAVAEVKTVAKKHIKIFTNAGGENEKN